MLIGTFCRFSARFCAVTVTVLERRRLRCSVAAVPARRRLAASCGAACGAGEPIARQIAAASGRRAQRPCDCRCAIAVLA